MSSILNTAHGFAALRFLLLNWWLASRVVGAVSPAYPSALSVPPSQYWDGIDGSWSTFGIQLGTPSQEVRVLPATGSVSTWVVTSDICATSSSSNAGCTKSRGGLYSKADSSSWNEIGIYELDLYVEGSLGYSGNALYGFEALELGWPGNFHPPVRVEKQVVAAMATTDFYLGTLGLNPWPVNFTTLNNGHPSLLSTLKNQSFIPSVTWGYTAGARGHSLPVMGSLTLGGYDRSRFVPNTLSFSMGADISRDLLVSTRSIRFPSITGTSIEALASPVFAYIDSLVPHIWIPQSACQAFESGLSLIRSNSKWMPYQIDSTFYETLVAKNWSMTIEIGPSPSGDSVSIEIPYWSFVLNASNTQANNSQPTLYLPLKCADNDTQYTLGRAFLQNAYVIANYEYFNFSVSQAKYPAMSTPQDIVTLCPRGGCAKPHRMSAGVIAGIAVAVAITICLIVVGTGWYLNNRRSEVAELPTQDESDVLSVNGKEIVGASQASLHEASDGQLLPGELSAAQGPKALPFELAGSHPVVSELDDQSIRTSPRSIA